MKSPDIFSIGFEGSHRAGKGTQIELFKEKLEKLQIPFVVVRGAGTRPNEGKHEGDPVSEWWTKRLPLLRRDWASIEDWNDSSYRLARELVVFRDRILPNMLKESGSSIAFLLVDRSILSETMTQRENGDDKIDLYPDSIRTKGKIITAEEVCPDILFNFITDQKTLLSRLDSNDPKYEFRKALIEQKADWYKNAKEYIPEDLRDKVVEIDASKNPEEIHDEIVRLLLDRFSSLKDFF